MTLDLDAFAAAGLTEASTDSAASMLDDVRRFLRRFVMLTPSQTAIVALWVAHTHAIEAADATPFLAITSPEKQSGKTRLLEVLELLVRNPWRTVLPSGAVLYRKIEQQGPTLLLDEIDAVFGPKAGEHEDLRSLLNAGNRRGTTVDRCTGKGDIKLQTFSVFCPRALAGIGRLPDTVADRSIPIRLRRRAPSESVERLRCREVEPEAARLRARLKEWAGPVITLLREARPTIPSLPNDRAEEGVEPLLAIADAAGGEWPERARSALVELYGGATPEDDTLTVRLLRDCRFVFDGKATDRLASGELAKALVGIEEAPWGELHGKPLTVRGLARLLNPYGIIPGSIRLEDGSTPKGYYRALFEDAWLRYLPPPISPQALQSATSTQANAGAGFLDSSIRHRRESVADEKPEIDNVLGPCVDVADGTPPGRTREEAVGPCGFHRGGVAAPCDQCGRAFLDHVEAAVTPPKEQAGEDEAVLL